MLGGEICERTIIVVQRNDTVLEAAKLMRQHGCVMCRWLKTVTVNGFP